MGFEIAIDINASEERVWSALTDVEDWPQCTSSMTLVTRIDSGEFGIGSQARIKQPKIGTMTWTVMELTPAHSFGHQLAGSMAVVASELCPPARGLVRLPQSPWTTAEPIHQVE
jgi:carbon monoxide dehydrogenase subunit G